jgi:TDG/mug DNA glycosylase family protein
VAEFEPDILTEGLDVVFCGLNFAASAVEDGYHFSHRNNRFWPVLYLAGFTDVRLQPADQRRLHNRNSRQRCVATHRGRSPFSESGL